MAPSATSARLAARLKKWFGVARKGNGTHSTVQCEASESAEHADASGRQNDRQEQGIAHRFLDADWVERTTEADIFWCFRLLLGSPPHEEEWPAHLTRLDADLASVVKSYLGSLEFAHRQLLENSSFRDIQSASVNGATIYASPLDPVIGKAVITGSYEPEIVSLFHKYLKPGMNVVDVGPNVGYFSVLAASIVGQSGHVTAIEPNPENVRLLEASRRANGFQNLDIMLMAASDQNGLLILNAGETNGTTASLSVNPGLLKEATLVPSIRLDTLLPRDRKVDFLKIDIEGAEYLAINGAIETLALHKPTIVSEFSPYALPHFSGCTGETYLGLLVKLGYAISVVAPNGDLAGFGQDIEGIMSAFYARQSDHIDILAEPV